MNKPPESKSGDQRYTKPLISIIINNYNYAQYLTAAIDSALAQSYVNTEVIVVDDGSTDNSRKIIERYGDRLTAISQKNGGQGAAYNTGFAASRGDFVCFFDADDILHPNAMTEAVAAFNDTRIVKVEWQMEVIDATGYKNGSVVPEKPLPSDLREQTISNGPFYDWWITAPGSGTCYRRSMLDHVLPMPTEANRHGADVYLTVLAPICGNVRRLDDAFGCYRQHEKNNYFGRALTNDRLKYYLRRFGSYSTAVHKHLASQGVEINEDDWKRRNFNYLWPSRLLKAKEEIERVIPGSAGYVLIDNNELAADNLVPGRSAVPFVERNGTYWGPPPDERAALVELERLISKGIGYVVLWWTAFWWLTEYFALNKYLHKHATLVIDSDALKIFQLCKSNLESGCASPSAEFMPTQPSECRTVQTAGEDFVRPESPRRFTPLGMGAEEFFTELLRRNCRYVSLRWFEGFPNLVPGDDIDLLVADDDLGALEEILHPAEGAIPCDVYTVSGLPATDYRNIAYYPPYLAEQILDRRVLYKGVVSIPSTLDHFFSFTYHAIYHKGLNAGIATSLQNLSPSNSPEHDYANKIASIADQCGLDRFDMTMESLDEFLLSQGWRPPLDTLARLAPHNRWIKKRFFSSPKPADPVFQGLSVFVLRERTNQMNAVSEIQDLLRASGFEIVAVKHLSENEANVAAKRIRGGNWGCGPWPTSGGGPAIVIIGRDANPLPVPEALLHEHPMLDNARIPAAKESIRNAINLCLPESERCNVIHSSDNAQHALEYLQITMPEREEQITTFLRTWCSGVDPRSLQCAQI